MERELAIKITADRDEAKRAIDAELADLQKIVDARKRATAESVAEAKAVGEARTQEAKKSVEAEVAGLKRTRDERGRTTKEGIDDARRLGDETAGALGKVEAGAGGAGDAVKSFFGQFLSATAAQDVLTNLVVEFHRVQKAAEEAGKEVTGNRASMRELSALRGNAGDTSKTEVELLRFRQQTLQGRDEAIGFQSAALGAGASSIGKDIQAGEFEDLMARAGAFQAMIGADADVMGGLTGMIPSLVGEKNQSGEQLFGKIRQLESIFNPGAGTYSQLSDQLLSTSALTKTGVFKDISDQAALISSFSLTDAAKAGTMTEQFTRATVGSLGRMRGAPIMEGIGDDEIQKQAEYLKGIGATEAMDPIEIGRLIARELEEARASAGREGRDFNPITHFQSKGYGNDEDINTLMAFAGGLDTFDQKFLPLARAPIDTSGAMTDIRRFQKNDPYADKMRADLAEDAATFQQGAGAPERIEQLRRATFAQMVSEGQAQGDYEGYTSGMLGYGHQQEIDIRAARHLNAQLPPEQRDRSTEWWVNQFTPGDQAETLGKLAERVQSAGGNIMPSGDLPIEGAERVGGKLDKLIQQNDEAMRLERERRMTPPPIRAPVKPQDAKASMR